MDSQQTASARSVGTLAAVIVLVLAGGLARVATTAGRSGHPARTLEAAGPRLAPEPAAPVPSTTPPTTAPPPPAATAYTVPTSTVLAAPKGTITTYGAPGGAPTGTLGTWYGYALVVPVVADQPGWLQVRLPQRPNGSTAWVQVADVTLSTTPYDIVVDLGLRNLFVYDAGRKVMAFPIGIGLPATPTVTGHYFVAVREPGIARPDYGPLILDTSAHSDAIQSWDGMGDAIIAIHGPITSAADSEIGAGGARVSNGCIRLHDSDLAQLAVIPVGAPVDIYA